MSVSAVIVAKPILKACSVRLLIEKEIPLHQNKVKFLQDSEEIWSSQKINRVTGTLTATIGKVHLQKVSKNKLKAGMQSLQETIHKKATTINQ